MEETAAPAVLTVFRLLCFSLFFWETAWVQFDFLHVPGTTRTLQQEINRINWPGLGFTVGNKVQDGTSSLSLSPDVLDLVSSPHPSPLAALLSLLVHPPIIFLYVQISYPTPTSPVSMSWRPPEAPYLSDVTIVSCHRYNMVLCVWCSFFLCCDHMTFF